MVRAVTTVFVELHKRGLIYRAKRLVNWHPGLETAISDLEVENIEVNGHMWHLRYPLADGVTYQFPIKDETAPSPARRRATTSSSPPPAPRPCSATRGVAVHPEDERYKHLIGKYVDPAAGRPPHPDRRRRVRRSRRSAPAR